MEVVKLFEPPSARAVPGSGFWPGGAEGGGGRQL